MLEAEQLFAGIEKGSKSFGLDATDTSEGSRPEVTKDGEPAPQGGDETKVVVPEAEEENIPFHKHPRWIAQKRKDEEKTQLISKLTSEIDEIKQSLSQMTSKEQAVAVKSLPEEFVRLFGDQPEAWTDMDKLITSRAEAIVDSRFKAMSAQEQERQLAEQRANEYIENEFSTLAESTGQDFSNGSSLRNAVMKIANEYRPANDTGDNISLAKSYDLYMRLNPQGSDLGEKKRIASNASGIQTSGSGTELDGPITPSKLRKASLSNFF